MNHRQIRHFLKVKNRRMKQSKKNLDQKMIAYMEEKYDLDSPKAAKTLYRGCLSKKDYFQSDIGRRFLKQLKRNSIHTEKISQNKQKKQLEKEQRIQEKREKMYQREKKYIYLAVFSIAAMIAVYGIVSMVQAIGGQKEAKQQENATKKVEKELLPEQEKFISQSGFPFDIV